MDEGVISGPVTPKAIEAGRPLSPISSERAHCCLVTELLS